ncbi:MAG: NADP-dependent oxidoreductase [Blastocatellia bacterium]
MKAIRIHEYGGADVLRYEDAPVTELLPDDVLIRVAAASFNPIDAKIRQGFMQEHLPKLLPFVLGWDCAGTVERIGGEVSRFKVGDEVFTMPEFARGGTYAEFVAVNENQVARKPQTLSLVEAAALPMTAQTALTALKAADVRRGQTILIHGGAGGVGTMAIQMAKARGASVVTTASGSGIELVKDLGADEVIDYKAANFRHVVSNMDVVLDLIGGQTQEDSWGVLKKGGVLVATAFPPAPEKAVQHSVRATFIFTQPSGAALEEIAALVDDGNLRPVISAEISLANARQAHEAKGGNGKTVIRIE